MGEIIHDRTVKIELYNDHFENAKRYQIPRAQLIIADIPYCYDTETECLTKNGWKKYNEITYEDEVLSLEPDSQQMEWSKIKNIIIRENDKTLLHFKNQNMDFMVTENHRMFTYHTYTTSKNGKSVTKTKKDGVRLAKDITQSCYIPRNNYKWDGTDFKKVQFGISWRSIGQVDIETAKWFSEFLNDTIKVAEKLNEEFKDIEIDWSK